MVKKAARGKKFSLPLEKAFDSKSLQRLGSKHGGWVYVGDESLRGSTVLLAGAGEDISFDVEFCTRYRATAIICDPTPRAIQHVGRVIARLGLPPTVGYSLTGFQQVESYDLTNLSNEQILFFPFALVPVDGPVELFAPLNPENVSHSISNFQRGFSDFGPKISVQGICLQSLLTEAGKTQVALIKLDIEGAEVQIMDHVVSAMSPTSQLLVEFDELTTGEITSQDRARDATKILNEAGFRAVWQDGNDFLFIGEELLSRHRKDSAKVH